MKNEHLHSENIRGCKIAWQEAGTGPALVLLHGIGGSSESWHRQIGQLKNNFRVVAWDMPGYGGSEKFKTSSPNVDHYVDSLFALLEFLGIRKVNLLGQSIAALIAARFCKSYPERVLSYVFAHGLTGLGELDRAARIVAKKARLEVFEALGPQRFAREKAPAIMSPNVTEKVREKVVEIMARVKPEGFRQAVEMLSKANFFSDAPFIEVPSLVLCGDDDPISPEPLCRAVAEALPDAQFRLIAHAGHYSAMEQPKTFNQMLDEFLSDIS